MNSIVHYEKQASSTTSITLSEGNIERILGANAKRTKIGGTHGHDEQCQKIPDQINFELYGVNLELCYKRYLCLFLLLFQRSKINKQM